MERGCRTALTVAEVRSAAGYNYALPCSHAVNGLSMRVLVLRGVLLAPPSCAYARPLELDIGATLTELSSTTLCSDVPYSHVFIEELSRCTYACVWADSVCVRKRV